MGGGVVPGIDFFQNLRVIRVVIAHQRSTFNTEAVPPECQMSNCGRRLWQVSR